VVYMQCSTRPRLTSFARSCETSGSKERTSRRWLIFEAPEADIGVHPIDGKEVVSGTADISFYCDDVAETVRELQSLGVEFTQGIEDHGYGLVTYFKAPGGFSVQLYQPNTGSEQREITSRLPVVSSPHDIVAPHDVVRRVRCCPPKRRWSPKAAIAPDHITAPYGSGSHTVVSPTLHCCPKCAAVRH